MPIRLVIHDLPNPLSLNGSQHAATPPPVNPPTPWAIFQLMQQHDVYPAKSVLRVARSTLGILEGLNAGTWTVGVVDISEELGMSARTFAALAEPEKEAARATARDRFLEAGADAVIDGLHELTDAIMALNELG